MTSPTHTNRLAGQSSPYLLQHAHNPVDWFPWGDEAFAEARRRDVPIFLSIGYSTCYWCHVMERESFEHEPTAALMNERFVCVKVDREQRPDVDDIYMTATQVMTGHGGWPMSCFLEPASLRPYWCGTYFPREPRHGLPSFAQVLRAMSDAWRDRRNEVLEQSEQVGAAVREALASDAEPAPIGAAHVSLAVESLLRSFDRNNGGFGGAPKFPQPANLMLLLEARESADEDTRAAIDVVMRTSLDRMAIGGMHDQVGGGFHRYSVDATWTVPHFEKMLYDNAQLAALYARAAGVYDDAYYRRITRRTLDYVLREMSAGDEPGATGFFSAQDAEVNGREGLNYLWTPGEVRAALPADDADFAIGIYGLDKGPNFKDPHHPDEPGRSVLRLADRPDRLASDLGLSPEALTLRLDRVNQRLYEARARRRQPGLDDKIIVAWNGLMIEALAEGAESLAEPRYVEAADLAAQHVLTRMRDADGTLLRIARAGEASTPAFLEDHATLIRGLVALGRSRFAKDRSRLHDAAAIADAAHDAFADKTGYFDTRAGQADLFVRTRSNYDGAMPCGSSLMLGALLSLAEATGEARFLDRAVGVLASLSPRLAQSPASVVEGARQLLRAIRARDRIGDRYAFATGAAAERAGPARPVRALVSADRVEVGEDRPASLRLRLEIDEPYHIVAADPGPGGEGLAPLRVGLVRGQGVAVYADYPRGEELASEIPGVETIHVHRGVIELDLALERKPGVGAGPGDPVLGVSFQACTDTECLHPMTVQLGVEIDLAD